jgi:hypothetical protein
MQRLKTLAEELNARYRADGDDTRPPVMLGVLGLGCRHLAPVGTSYVHPPPLDYWLSLFYCLLEACVTFFFPFVGLFQVRGYPGAPVSDWPPFP